MINRIENLVPKGIFRLCFAKAPDKTIDIFYSPMLTAMNEFLIDNLWRISAYFAQVIHESGSLHYIEEISSGEAYEFRKDLGNLEEEALESAHSNHTTSGKFYKGRGILQITGYYNYKMCGEALNLPLVTNPRLLLEPINSCRASAWFWKSHRLNTLADQGKFSDITHVINGGYIHEAEREELYRHCKKVLGIL